MRLTRAQIADIIRPGDGILVHYLEPNIISVGIQFASKGTASHALCCLGGMEIVEADIGGVMHTYLDNYLTGKCRLTIKRLRPELDHGDAARACDYWRSCISQPYDMGMIAHTILVTPVRRWIQPICHPLGRFLLRAIGILPLASHRLSTCGELIARGWRTVRPKFLRGYDAEDILPEVLLRDAAGLEIVAVWDAPVLIRDVQ